MPSVQLADVSLNYRFDGPEARLCWCSPIPRAPTCMWDAQIPAFAEHFRVLRYDTRGHGASGVTPGPYSIEQLGHDVLGMLAAFGMSASPSAGCPWAD